MKARPWPIITFLSDFGLQDHYVAAVKAVLWRSLPGVTIADLSHQVESCNIAQAAYIARAVWREFAPGTIHLWAVHTVGEYQSRLLAAAHEGHYFLANDNGLLSLVLGDQLDQVVQLPADTHQSSFPTKDLLAPAAALLARGAALESLGQPVEQILIRRLRQLQITPNSLIGSVIYIDGRGNLMTNIQAEAFERWHQERLFVLRFGRQTLDRLGLNYHSVEYGECTAFFNSLGLLEIAIHQGNAAQLLGMRFDSPVILSAR